MMMCPYPMLMLIGFMTVLVLVMAQDNSTPSRSNLNPPPPPNRQRPLSTKIKPSERFGSKTGPLMGTIETGPLIGTIDQDTVPMNEEENDATEEYGDIEQQVNKPDQVDNEVIERLVDRFLNTGTAEESPETKINIEAQKLINSSQFWSIDDLKPSGSIADAGKASEWLIAYAKEAEKVLLQVTTAGWNYFTMVSNEHKRMLAEAEEVLSAFVRSSSKQAQQFKLEAINDPSMRRQLQALSVEGLNALSHDQFANLTDLQNKLNTAFVNAVICEHGQSQPCSLRQSDLIAIFTRETNPIKLLHFWKAWRMAVGDGLKDDYARLVHLINQGAEANGFTDGGAMWRSPYELSSRLQKPKVDMITELNKLFHEILPFYQQLHSYMRRQLTAIFPATVSELSRDGPIPAHLLGSMHGEHWMSHLASTRPFDENEDETNSNDDDLVESMKKLNYTARTMFSKASKYMKQIGLGKLPKSFWHKSIFVRSWNKDMLCHPPVAYDMRDGADFRLKACTVMSEADWRLAHELIAQVYYQYLYRNQPLALRESAPSVSTAIAKVFSILASSPAYLKRSKLRSTPRAMSAQVNSLYREAVEDFVRLPFDLVVDTWRYRIFEGKLAQNSWDEEWWRLRESYQGLRAPINGSKGDALSTPTIAQQQSPAIRHFVSYIMQFQILAALCPNATQLHEGCILNEAAGVKLRRAMTAGSSATWQEALQMLTGDRKLSAKALLRYYQPLIGWLENENERFQTVIGWDGAGTPFTPEERAPSRGNHTTIADSGLPSDDQVAFPGADCSSGQECLLDSMCKQGTCQCNEGLYTLRIGETVNCVPGNPADYFGNGTLFGLYPNDAPTPVPEPEPEPTPQIPSSGSIYFVSMPISIVLLCLSLMLR